MYLLDTVVLSEIRKRQRDPAVVQWVTNQRDADLFLSAVTIGEIERGIVLQKNRNSPFSDELSHWLDRILSLYSDRVLPVDIATARRWGRLSAEIGNDSPDLLIAATAMIHGLTVVTRNTRHFEPTGVAVLNPFSQ
ncbi:MAG: type II toxin-antitoxin system VapC family toxin [Pseudohongiellaceae bacterium]